MCAMRLTYSILEEGVWVSPVIATKVNPDFTRSDGILSKFLRENLLEFTIRDGIRKTWYKLAVSIIG